jgi:hypothetical protein
VTGGMAAFIVNIFAGLNGQLQASAALATGNYCPVSMSVEWRLIGSAEAVWTFP